MPSISSMIEELTDVMSYYDRQWKVTYQRTLFPAPARVGMAIGLNEGMQAGKGTHVCREPTVENSDQTTTTSIRKNCHSERTTSPCRCTVIRKQWCDFSTGQAERANFGYHLAASHLPDNLSAPSSGQVRKSNSRFDLFKSLASFCMISNVQSDMKPVYVAKNIYRGHPGRCQPMTFRLRERYSTTRSKQTR